MNKNVLKRIARRRLKKMPGVVFGGVIVVILLGFYVYAVVYAIMAVSCLSNLPCEGYTKDLTPFISGVLETIGGLVAATVVAELAITQPGQQPASRLLAADATQLTMQVTTALVWLYVGVWIICGVAEVWFGWAHNADVVPALTSSAKSWFGLAIAAGYSYFGISPPAEPNPSEP